jgi:cytosine/adenosine deaminase-related metal-dependent hydrolase
VIIGPACIVTGGPEPRILEEGGVRVAGAHIAQIAPIGVLAETHRDETVWPAGGRLLLPGLVNAHAHLGRHLARGLTMSEPPEWERYDRALAPEDVRWAALAALAEGVRHGITTTCDLHRSGSFLDFSLSEVADAATRLGVRVATAYAAHEDDSPAARRAALDESMGLAAEIRRARSGRIHALLGMRARTAAGLLELLREVEDVADPAVGVHVELAEDDAPHDTWRAESARPSLWAHAERAGSGLRLVEPGALAVQSPGARRALEPPVAWGSDSGPMAPPNLDPSVPDAEVIRRHYERVFVSGPRWAERVFGEGLGVIEPGAPADLLLVDYRPPTDLDRESLGAHLAACVGRAAVSGVMTAGEIVMDHGILVTVDEAEISARARECARRVRQRL